MCSHSIPAELKSHFVLCPIFSSDFLLLSLLTLITLLLLLFILFINFFIMHNKAPKKHLRLLNINWPANGSLLLLSTVFTIFHHLTLCSWLHWLYYFPYIPALCADRSCLFTTFSFFSSYPIFTHAVIVDSRVYIHLLCGMWSVICDLLHTFLCTGSVLW